MSTSGGLPDGRSPFARSTTAVTDEPASRTHVDVAERRFNGRTMYAAVYPPMPAGAYTVWLDYTGAKRTSNIY